MASKTGYINSEKNFEQSFDTPPMSYDVEVPEGEVDKVKGSYGIKLWIKKLSVETGGIQRVTDEDRVRETSKVWNACTFWQVFILLTSTSCIFWSNSNIV